MWVNFHTILLVCGCVETDVPVQNEVRRLVSWGTDLPDDLALDQKRLAEALKNVSATTHLLFPFFHK